MKVELSELLTGKNTIEAALTLSEAFVSRFGAEYGSASEIASKLLPRGKASTWASLDKNINLFCRQFYPTWYKDEDKVLFFDEVRFFLQTLPMKRDYKLPPEKLEFSDPEKASEYFTTCSLCWRSVFRKPLEKKTPLCQLHDLPSTHREYRKRNRLKIHKETIKRDLLKSQPPLTLVKHELGAELNDYVKDLCLRPDGPLSYLTKYLYSLKENYSLPLSNGKDILQALEYPISISLQKTRVIPIWYQAWEYYLIDYGHNFRLNYLRILEAESWLRAEAEHTHGGKRRWKKV